MGRGSVGLALAFGIEIGKKKRGFWHMRMCSVYIRHEVVE